MHISITKWTQILEGGGLPWVGMAVGKWLCINWGKMWGMAVCQLGKNETYVKLYTIIIIKEIIKKRKKGRKKKVQHLTKALLMLMLEVQEGRRNV